MKKWKYLEKHNLSEQELDDLGKTGWELVTYQVVEGEDGYGEIYTTYYYIFKRELVEPQDTKENNLVENIHPLESTNSKNNPPVQEDWLESFNKKFPSIKTDLKMVGMQLVQDDIRKEIEGFIKSIREKDKKRIEELEEQLWEERLREDI